MSFGGAGQSTGFSFGQSNPATTTTSGGLFGSSTGTGFGQVASTTNQSASGGFSFGGSAAAQPGGFGAAPPAATSAPTGFPFGGAPAAASTPATGLSFGAGAPQKPLSGFSFASTPATTATQQPASGFSFGGGASATGFGGAPSTAPSTGGFSFNQTTAPSTMNQPTFGGLGGGGGGGTLSGGSKPFSFATPAPVLATATTAPGGFSFSQPALAMGPTTTANTGGLSLGTSFGGQAAIQKPTTQTTQPVKPFDFGKPSGGGFSAVSSATSTATAASQPASGGFSFSAQKSTAAPSATASALGGFGGLGTKLGSATTSSSSSTPAPAAGGFSLGGKISSTPAGLSALASTTPVASTTSTTSGIKLGSGMTLFNSSSLAQTTSAAPVIPATKSIPGSGKGFSLGGISTAAGTTAATSVTTSAATTAAPTMRYSDLEKKVNTWTSELEQQEKLFLTQATHVNAWNKLLIENADKITNLNSEFENVESSQKRLTAELDYIKTQQMELEELLKPLEENTKQQMSALSSSVHTHHADIERERTYNLAENIDSQLKNMAQDLREVVEHINSTSAPADANNPILQIGKILSAHMDSLQWLDSNSASLHHKVQDMSKQVDVVKKDHESKFRLAFN